MSFLDVFTKDRQVIPRWHTYPLARWLGVTKFHAIGPKKRSLDEDYGERVRAWQEMGKISHASDLVGNALVLNNFDDQIATEAAEFILRNRPHATEPLIEVTTTFLRLARNEPFPLPDIILPEDTKKFHIAIANIKKRTREYPRNPILWMDLAFYYSTLGQNKAADNAVKVALSLNKENRYLLRSSSRFYIHNKTPDKALSFLRKSSVGQHDPWLLAAEIAISDILSSPSKRHKTAKDLVVSHSIPQYHLSELASVLGTIELKNGSWKRGKKLFAFALEDPTENVVAQAIFLNSLLGDPIIILRPEHLPDSYEAQTRVRFQKGDFQGSLEAAKKWFAYQPFSSRPAVAASYIASVALGRFEEASRIAKMGQAASPDEFMLKNNRAFSLASLGKTEEAKKVLETVFESKLPEPEKNVLAATRGVIEFREGNFEQGRKYYKTAIDSFKRHKDMRAEAVAKFFWAREEKIIKSPEAMGLMEEAEKLSKKLNLSELLPHFEKQK